LKKIGQYDVIHIMMLSLHNRGNKTHMWQTS